MSKRPSPTCPPPARQRGVVLMVALIILIAMTLAGVALIRSVDTANVIAGNLAFHESATHAGERGTEVALAESLLPYGGPGNATLWASHADKGYVADLQNPNANESWDAFWNRSLKDMARAASPLGQECANAVPDAAGNRVCYVIHRLCDQAAQKPNIATNPCTKPPPGSVASGGSQRAGSGAAPAITKVYYRITTRIEGPRRTVSYIQTIVAR